MSEEVVQINEFGEAKTDDIQVDVSNSGSVNVSVPPSTANSAEDTLQSFQTKASSTANSAEDTLQSFQTKASALLDNAGEYTGRFLKNNQQLLITLGWILLALVGVKLLFTALDVVDDIPLISPLFRLIGLIYSGWFVWRYLLRAQNRQELAQTIDQAKSELLGN